MRAPVGKCFLRSTSRSASRARPFGRPARPRGRSPAGRGRRTNCMPPGRLSCRERRALAARVEPAAARSPRIVSRSRSRRSPSRASSATSDSSTRSARRKPRSGRSQDRCWQRTSSAASSEKTRSKRSWGGGATRRSSAASRLWPRVECRLERLLLGSGLFGSARGERMKRSSRRSATGARRQAVSTRAASSLSASGRPSRQMTDPGRRPAPPRRRARSWASSLTTIDEQSRRPRSRAAPRPPVRGPVAVYRSQATAGDDLRWVRVGASVRVARTVSLGVARRQVVDQRRRGPNQAARSCRAPAAVRAGSADLGLQRIHRLLCPGRLQQLKRLGDCALYGGAPPLRLSRA